MPELPEVEIVVRRLGSTLHGAEVESVLALSLRTTSQPVLDEILDAWFATDPSPEREDVDNIRHLDHI